MRGNRIQRFVFTAAGATLLVSTTATAEVAPVALSTSTNLGESSIAGPHTVAANEALGMVVFIHRQDVNVWGGGSSAAGMFRYDVSFDGGLTFNTEIGPVNTFYSREGRYPQVAIEERGDNPFDARLIWLGATLSPSRLLDGHVSGAAELATSGAVLSSESYDFQEEETTFTTSLTEGLPGEFWAVESPSVDSTEHGSLRVYRGELSDDAVTIAWAEHTLIAPGVVFSGGTPIYAPSVAFAPDGMTGWVAMLANSNSGIADTLVPVLSRTEDGGETWGPVIQVDLTTISWLGSESTLRDELLSLGLDQSGIPVPLFEADLTVDAGGNPHFVFAVANHEGDGTGTLSLPNVDVGQLLIDVTSTDGGESFEAVRVANLFGYEGPAGFDSSTGETLPLYNFPQVARTESGSHVFYSWVDSPTDLGSAPGDNLAPNLLIRGMRAADHSDLTEIVNVTVGDIIWDSGARFPVLAPTVLRRDGNYHLPIVILRLDLADTSGTVSYHYFGNDAVIADSMFVVPDPGEDAGGDAEVDAGDDVEADAGGDTGDIEDADAGSDAAQDVDSPDAGDDVVAPDADGSDEQADAEGSEADDGGDGSGEGSGGGGGSGGCAVSGQSTAGAWWAAFGLGAAVAWRRRRAGALARP